jgi:hypothetical protein
MTDPNCSIDSSYQILVENQVLYFLKFFWVGRKLLDLRNLDRPIVIIFFLLKNSKKNSKNIKFDFLQEFDIKNKLNGLDRSFLT